MSYNFKTYNDLEIAESLGDASYVLVEENGEVKRFAAAGIAAATSSSKLDLYNIDNLSREEMIAFAEEMKEFRYLRNYDQCSDGDLRTSIKVNTNYQLYYNDEDIYWDYCDPCNPTEVINPASWTLTADAFTLNLTEEEYNEIFAAWEALCVNA